MDLQPIENKVLSRGIVGKSAPTLAEITIRKSQNIVALAKHVEGWKTGQLLRDIFKHIPELSYVYLYAQECQNPRWKAQKLMVFR